ncbi:MAG: 5'/3'-nucleotidase SurE [Pseudomonadota bacterium]
MRILITNDDGARADGIKLLEEIARTFTDDVWLVAPESDQSGVSHAISLHEPLRIHQETERHFYINGTPADCAVLGVEHILDRKPDLVLSGVNRGGNMADSIAYSGTVGAAMTALLMGVRSMALSQFLQSPTIHWETAKAYAVPLIERLLTIDWPRPVCPNINFPACPPEEVKGVRVCRPGHGYIGGVNVEQRFDMRGGAYHWLQFRRSNDVHEDPTCDLALLRQNYVTITPLRLDRHAEGDADGFRDKFGEMLAAGPLPHIAA